MNLNDHTINPTKLNITAKAMPATKFIPPSTALIPDDPLAPVVAEPVDVDVPPVAVPDAEADVLLELLVVEKVATGSTETVLQVPPIELYF